MGKYPKMALISWALVWKYGFKRSYLNNNVRNQSNYNNVLYIVFYHLFDDINDFSKNSKQIWNFDFFVQ